MLDLKFGFEMMSYTKVKLVGLNCNSKYTLLAYAKKY